ncbi:hypothetical protein FQP90_18775 [Paenarthrobacter nitroguajacolicus]|uniref:Uncharacterized protein n=1 Tax=Paenarthrobacter nitroguajacolicus TaxID=211146 RepID=A0A558GRD1_PAENT|nr:hypothetical protein [Paenarthrobacter nitroguajacolicus]TVU59441.1 hypothetical protein FQP90_18775 [Paenarthrobacter nitroguajacolicus]
MTANNSAENINPEVASHLVESMGMAPMPEPATIAVALGADQGRQWPDGSGKRRHLKERDQAHGRMGQGAAVTAIHRTSRPQMPHSS